MAEHSAEDKPTVAGAPNAAKDDNSSSTKAAMYGYICDTDDFLDLSAEGRQELLKIWCDKQTPSVKNVITALKNLELERIEQEENYNKKLAELELKYQNELNEINKQRADIIRGTIEPELVEAPWMENERKLIEDSLPALEKADDSQLEHALAKVKLMPSDAKGIPAFWLHILKNIELTSDLIEKADEAVLEKLYDIKVVQDNVDGFVLEFYFEENEYFTNDKLYKTYKYQYNHDKHAPFEYEGPYIKSCSGCTIDWVKDKNLTVSRSTRQLRKKNGRTVTMPFYKSKKSFFNFFKTPKVNDLDDCNNDSSEIDELQDDFDLAEELKNEIIPKAVLYYAGNIAYECDIDDSDSGSECSEENTDQTSSVDSNSQTD